MHKMVSISPKGKLCIVMENSFCPVWIYTGIGSWIYTGHMYCYKKSQTMPALCTGFYFPFAIWMRWVLDWIGIGSRLPQENHARPLQWVVHTGGYLEVPPDPRHSSSHQMLLDLVDRIPLERGRPPPDLAVHVFILIFKVRVANGQSVTNFLFGTPGKWQA